MNVSTPEEAAWMRLVLLGTIPADEPCSEVIAAEGGYTRKVRELGRIPLEEPAPKGKPSKSPKPSTTEVMEALRARADALLDPASTIPPVDRLIHLQQMAREMWLALGEGDLRRLLWEARRRRAGAVEMAGPGAPLDLASTRWAWEGVLMAQTTNLIVALPKVGKTSLLIAAIAAWHRGERTFLGQPFHGPCPPVILAGTDMPAPDWGELLIRFGLLNTDGSFPDDGPIRGLFHAGAPVHLDAEGIGRLADLAARSPSALLIVDSYSKVVSPLGVAEKSSDYAGPLGDLQEALAPHEATLVVVHHSGKERAGDGAAMASRGTTALPAAVSQIITLNRFQQGTGPSAGQGDRRLMLRTEGRGGLPVQLLIEQQDHGWILHGDAETVIRLREMEQTEAALNDRQGEVLDLLRERWQQDNRRTGSGEVVRALGLNGPTALRKARRALEQLEHRGLARSSMVKLPNGQQLLYEPLDVARSGSECPLPYMGFPISPLSPLSPVQGDTEDESPKNLIGMREGTGKTHRTGVQGIRDRGHLGVPSPWRLQTRLTGRRAQITNGQESRVVAFDELPRYGLVAPD